MAGKPTYEELEQMVLELEEEALESKHVEETLRESEEHYRHTMDASVAGIYIIQDLIFKYVNPTMAKLHGYKPEEIENRLGPADLVVPEQREVIQQNLIRRAHGEPGKPYEIKCYRKDGSVFDAMVWGKAITYHGRPATVGTLIDITERVRAEEALRLERDNLHNIFESMEDGVYIVNRQYDIQYVNQVLVKDFGPYEGVKCYRYFHDRDEACPWCKNKDVWTGKTVRWEWYSFKNGKTYDLMDTPLTLPDGSIGKLEIFRDITDRKQAEKDRKKLEARLVQAQKMEAIGTLAGGIAHDFNNMLTSILGNISLAQMDTKPGTKVFELLNETEKAAIRAKDLTARLITFSKGGEPVKEVTSIGDLVKDSVISTLIDSGIDYGFSIPDDLSPTEIDEQQMKQVIYSITTNAQEAMTGKGTIKVYCENVIVGEKDALTLRKGKYVRISLEDQGAGIPKENLQKIFDPYFSTKEMGTQKGMGLGLAVCHSIVEKHDGLITVESELGIGTTFIVYLPASEKEIKEPEPVKKPVAERPVTGKGKILVMDDEEMVRNVSAAMFSKLGYKVKLAVDGVEAIELYNKARESGETFDAVILDLTNQFGMGGVEAIKKLLEIDPDIIGIVSTGYSNDPVVTNFREYGFRGALTKPFTMDELRKGLEEALKN